jgi:hypothetical protein
MTRAVQIIAWWCVPALWAFNMQFGQIAPYGDCVSQRSSSGIVTFGIVVIAVAIAVFASRQARPLAGTDRFLVLSGSLLTSILGFALLLQGLATLMIDPCLR